MRLSQRNYAIDLGLFPLGSCTMKHNPRLNEKAARMPGFADIHPLQPQKTVQGALELIDELATWLKTLTGMPAVAMSPKAGAHGELCGMLAIRQALIARGEATHASAFWCPPRRTAPIRRRPSSAALSSTRSKPMREAASIWRPARKLEKTDDIAGIMLTNPNTCGLFETDIKEIADLIHEAGGYFYCDGANFQRDCRPRSSRRSWRRCDAYQSAQDLLHAAWRRRPGLWSNGPVRRARAVCAGALCGEG
jgi:glycine dehydrogenase subunit 2